MTTVTDPDVRTASRRSRRDWALLALPQVILGGAMLVMLVAHPNAVRSGVMSTRAILVNAGLLTGWLLLSFALLPRLVRNAFVRSASLTALAVGAVIVLVVPTLHDTKVVEEFPEVAVAPRDEPPAASNPANMAATMAAPPPPPTTAPQPVRVSTGALHGIDHDASGAASIYQQPDGSFVVALEEIDVEPGPDYHVIIVPGRDRETPGEGTELAKLKGNQGTQYYEVPRDRGEVGPGWTVLIWCRAFGVPVANATQG